MLSGSGSAVARNGEATDKGDANWKGKGGWNGNGKGHDKTSLDITIENEYYPAWIDSNSCANGEHGECDGHNDGYNLHITNNPNWSGLGLRYSMVLTTPKRPIATGPNYFLVDVIDDDNDDTEEESGCTTDEPN